MEIVSAIFGSNNYWKLSCPICGEVLGEGNCFIFIIESETGDLESGQPKILGDLVQHCGSTFVVPRIVTDKRVLSRELENLQLRAAVDPESLAYKYIWVEGSVLNFSAAELKDVELTQHSLSAN